TWRTSIQWRSQLHIVAGSPPSNPLWNGKFEPRHVSSRCFPTLLLQLPSSKTHRHVYPRPLSNRTFSFLPPPTDSFPPVSTPSPFAPNNQASQQQIASLFLPRLFYNRLSADSFIYQ